MPQHQNNEDSLSRGSNEFKNIGVNSTKKIGNSKASKALDKKAKELAKKAGKAAKEGAKEAASGIFSAVAPEVLGILAAVLAVYLLIMLITSAMPFGSLFNKESETATAKIQQKLDNAYGKLVASRATKNVIYSSLNTLYGCNGTLNNLSYDEDTRTYTYHTDSCYIKTSFHPGVDEFIQEVDAYANAMNAAVIFFNSSEDVKNIVEEKPKITEQFVEKTDMVETESGKLAQNYELTEYGQDIIDEKNSEYADSQNEKFYKSLAKYASKMFTVEEDTERWTVGEPRNGKTVKTITTEESASEIRSGTGPSATMNYRISVTTTTIIETFDYVDGQYISVDRDESTSHSSYTSSSSDTSSSKSSTSWPTKCSEVNVYISCNPTVYKEEFIEGCVEKAKEETIFKKVLNRETDQIEVNKYEPQDIDDVMANNYVHDVINNYYFNYLSMFNNFTYTSGYAGLITSNGFNYSDFIDSNDTGKASMFWSYSNSLDSELHDLPYKNASKGSGSGPVMTRQCTQFAATFFYDVYGYAALRGDGRDQAFNLLYDCGEKGACPVQFAAATSPAPGAIVSLNPNHVIVVDQVDEDGTIYISEGNINDHMIRVHYKLEGGLAQYEKEMGQHVRLIVVPVKEEKGEKESE